MLRRLDEYNLEHYSYDSEETGAIRLSIGRVRSHTGLVHLLIAVVQWQCHLNLRAKLQINILHPCYCPPEALRLVQPRTSSIEPSAKQHHRATQRGRSRRLSADESGSRRRRDGKTCFSPKLFMLHLAELMTLSTRLPTVQCIWVIKTIARLGQIALRLQFRWTLACRPRPTTHHAGI